MKNYYKITKSKAGEYTVYANLAGIGVFKKVFSSETEARQAIEEVKDIYFYGKQFDELK